MASLRLTIDGTKFRDPAGREIVIRGINVAADCKLPSKPDLPSHKDDGFFDGDAVSFIDRPFSVEEAPTHFARLRRWGYNTLRYLFTWEAIEHAGPGKYDEEYIQFTVAVLKIAKEFGLYIFLDPHQDVWSRFSGGSGAPMWTLYACGLNPRNFAVTEAALVQNTWPEPAEFPKMIWSTNYYRLVCQVMFTCFFAGRDFAPKAIIDGKNIQDYLQSHFLSACQHLARRVHEAGDLENNVVIGWENFNEANRGLIGWQDISVVPADQIYRRGTTPTAWQAILTGSGRACEIDTWGFSRLGPYKSGTALIDPQGETAWLPASWDDSYYGWKRDPGWKLGECIWAQHGVWDTSTDTLLRKDYFAKHPKTGETLNYEVFTNTYFMEFFRGYRDIIRAIHNDAILFCQPPAFELPPNLKGTVDDDSRMVYAPHFYDGVTLVNKSWNRWMNVDVFGLLRGRYLGPPFAIKLGERAIRSCIKDQLAAIRQEGLDYMGEHPCVLTEIGIPFDMNHKHAYKTGDYSSQCMAMDANYFAIEGSGVNGSTLWVYMAKNDHQWGDHWNGEDLSLFSVDDLSLAAPSRSLSSPNSSSNLLSHTQSADKLLASSVTSVSSANLKDTLSSPSMAPKSAPAEAELSNTPGHRAAEAYIRPYPTVTAGDVTSYGFDLNTCVFTLSLRAPSPTKQEAPTEIFLPEYHFPSQSTEVEPSGGKWTISLEGGDEDKIQTLRWWHGEGDQTITIKGLVQRHGKVVDNEDQSYLGQFWQMGCLTM